MAASESVIARWQEHLRGLVPSMAEATAGPAAPAAAAADAAQDVLSHSDSDSEAETASHASKTSLSATPLAHANSSRNALQGLLCPPEEVPVTLQQLSLADLVAVQGSQDAGCTYTDPFAPRATGGSPTSETLRAVADPGAAFRTSRSASSPEERGSQKQLPLEYDVVKVTPLHRRLRRTLRLTRRTIDNLKKDEFTQSYPYEDVAAVYLAKPNRFVIAYFGNHDSTYESSLAPQIVQQIELRVIRRAEEEHQRIHAGALERVVAGAILPAAMVESARMSGRISKRAMLDAPTLQHASSDIVVPNRSVPKERDSGASRNGADAQHAVDKLARLTGENEEDRVYAAIRRILNQANSAEGSQRARFVDETYPQLRQQRRPLHGEQEEPAMITSAALHAVRNFVSGLFLFTVEARWDEIKQDSIQAAATGRPGAHDLDPTALATLLLQCIEESVVIPLMNAQHPELAPDMPPAELEAEQDYVDMKMQELRCANQSFFGITADHQSSGKWRSAISELNQMDAEVLPSRKLQVLLLTAHAIHEEHKLASAEHGQGETGTLSGDVFLSILAYVLARSRLSQPVIDRDMIWRLCAPAFLYGDGGYILAAFGTVLDRLKDLPAPSESEKDLCEPLDAATAEGNGIWRM